MIKHESTITHHNHNRRLDHWLLGIYPQTPKSHLQKMIRTKLIRVNHLKSTAAYRIQSGDIISYPQPEASKSLAQPYRKITSLEPNIKLDNEDFLIIDKPSGLPVHSGTGYSTGMIDDLESLYGHKLYLVHRLDRLTSGVMVVAKHPVMQNTLSQKFKDRDLSKIYHCVVKNWTHGDAYTLDAPLLRVRDNHVDTNIVDPLGLDSISEFKHIESVGKYSLLEVNLITGRMHQIRAHCKHLNSPILGDPLYGSPDKNDKNPGLMLLAKVLQFSHNECEISAQSLWPENKLSWLSKVGFKTQEITHGT